MQKITTTVLLAVVLCSLMFAPLAEARGTQRKGTLSTSRDIAAVKVFSKIFAKVFNLNDPKLQPTLFIPSGRRILLGETEAVGQAAIESVLTKFFGAVRSRTLTRFTRSVARVGTFNGSPLYREAGTYKLVSVSKEGKTARETGKVWTFWVVKPRTQPKVVRIVVRRGV